MHLQRIADARSISNASLASIAKYDLAPTPENYAVWYEYHSGQNPTLQRMIGIIESNNRGIDEQILGDLYEDFFTSTKEEIALHGISSRVQTTLHEVLQVVESARSDARNYGDSLNSASARLGDEAGPLAELLDRLVSDAREMAMRAGRVEFRLHQSVQKVRSLEQALDDVRKEASVDGLTQIGNRRAFDARLRETAGEAMNSGEDLSLILGDLDHFKRLNDTLGHPAGDSALCIVAEVLQQSVRGQDFVARYGGEEFAVILPVTSLAAAMAVGNNIRRNVEKAQVLERITLVPAPPVTMSIGVACYDPGEPLQDWLSRADRALYRAKNEGRNRVECE